MNTDSPIKRIFRAWNKQTKKMLDLQAVTPLATELKGIFIPLNEDLEIMQFTGLLDANGKEIYEGDIARCISLGVCGVVVWITKDARFTVVDRKRERYPMYRKWEVIGNIYEHPDLLLVHVEEAL